MTSSSRKERLKRARRNRRRISEIKPFETSMTVTSQYITAEERAALIAKLEKNSN